jgi:hypothetical protein
LDKSQRNSDPPPQDQEKINPPYDPIILGNIRYKEKEEYPLQDFESGRKDVGVVIGIMNKEHPLQHFNDFFFI